MPYLQPSSNNPFFERRLSTEDYCELLLCITQEPTAKSKAILQACLPAWLRVVNKLQRRPRRQSIKALNLDPTFSLQLTHLLRESIESMDSQEINRLLPEIGPALEELFVTYRRRVDIFNDRKFLP